MWWFFIPAFILFLVPSPANAQQSQQFDVPRFDVSRMNYLFSPVDIIISIRRQEDAKREELSEALRQACGALRDLVNDKEFEVIMQHYAERQYDDRISPDVYRIYREFEAFLEFLKIEREILLRYLSEEAVDELLAHMLATRLQASNFRIDYESVLQSLRETQISTCIAAEQVEEDIAHAELVYAVGRATLALVGATAVGVDSLLLSNPATAPFGIVSGIGGMYMMWAASR